MFCTPNMDLLYTCRKCSLINYLIHERINVAVIDCKPRDLLPNKNNYSNK